MVYIIDKKCTGYRWHKKWGNELKYYDLIKPEIVKQKQRNKCKKTIIKYPKLWQFHQGLEIDMSRVKKVLASIEDDTIRDIKEDMKNPNTLNTVGSIKVYLLQNFKKKLKLY